MAILHHLPDINSNLKSDKLKGKVVLITGGGSGLGRHVAIECSKAGAKVLVTDLNLAGCIETVRLCHLVGGLCKSPTEPTNVLSTSSLQKSIEFSRSQPGSGEEGGWGKTPDVVVANAGVVGGPQDENLIHDTSLGTYPKKQSPLALDVNLQGVIKSVNVIRQAWKEDDSQPGVGGKETRRGREVVLIASMGGLEGIPISTLYATAKHGVVGYWLGLCADLRSKGEEREFQCHVVCPFFSLTPLLPGVVKLLLAGCPKAPPPSVGKTILSLLSTSRTDLIPISSTSSSTTTEKAIEESAGLAILLPDDQRAFVIPDTEYDMLSAEMYGEIEEGIIGRGITIDDPSFKTVRNKEALEALSITKIQFLFLVGGIIITILFLCYTAYKTPTWISVLLGLGIGMMGRMGLMRKKVVRSKPN